VDADPDSDQMTFVTVPGGEKASAPADSSTPLLAEAPVSAKPGRRAR